ncbi:hypothetical protein [Clostridium sp. DL1XJH146]
MSYFFVKRRKKRNGKVLEFDDVACCKTILKNKCSHKVLFNGDNSNKLDICLKNSMEIGVGIIL